MFRHFIQYSQSNTNAYCSHFYTEYGKRIYNNNANKLGNQIRGKQYQKITN